MLHLKKAVRVSEELFLQCDRKADAKARTIFNNVGINDRKRVQCELPVTPQTSALTAKVGALVKATLGRIGHWDEDTNFLSTASVLKSKPGCKEQRAHTDFDVPAEGFGRHRPHGFPCGVIVALQDGTKFVVHGLRGGRVKKRTVVEMKAGDVLIFHGDLEHAGAAYDIENTRVHYYVDSTRFPRIPNKVY